VQQPQGSGRARRDPFARLAHRGVEPVDEGHEGQHAGVGCQVGHPLGVGDGRRQGLLADDGLACGDHGQRGLDVRVVRRADVDDVDVRRLDQLVEARCPTGSPEGSNPSGGGLGTGPDHGHDLAPSGPYGVRVHAADEAGPDDPRTEATTHVWSLRRVVVAGLVAGTTRLPEGAVGSRSQV